MSVPLICPEVPRPIYARSFAPKQNWHSWGQLHTDIWQGGHHLHVTRCPCLFLQKFTSKKHQKQQSNHTKPGSWSDSHHRAAIGKYMELFKFKLSCIPWSLCEPALIGPKADGFPNQNDAFAKPEGCDPNDPPIQSTLQVWAGSFWTRFSSISLFQEPSTT